MISTPIPNPMSGGLKPNHDSNHGNDHFEIRHIRETYDNSEKI